VRVAIADDSNLFRSGLRSLLQEVGVDVCLEAGDARELIALVADDPPDAVITDIRMPPTFSDEGLVAAATLKRLHPGIGVLVLSTYSETAYAVRLLEDGATGLGYLLKDRVDDIHSLVDALDRVCAGQTALDPNIVTRLIGRERRGRVITTLSGREREVLEHMAEGRSNAGIAQALALAQRTVESYVASVFTKLDIPISGDDNRRVLAVLRWMRATGNDEAPDHAP
jgi:DNA-binding NarL/FixJ family response regulator